jgi:hypothetical protein
VNVFVLTGFFVFPPLLWAACILCLTGNIYTSETGDDGFLTKCPSSTTIAAGFVIILQTVGIAYGLSYGLTPSVE